MTVNGVETPIVAGIYSGKVVLTPTIYIPMEDTMMGGKFNLRTAIYVDNGVVVPEKSVLSAVAGGTVTNTYASDINITSVGENFNGIIAAGNSKYSVINPRINFTGNGGSDFAAVGAAITSFGKADLTVNNARIITNGAIRTAVWVGGESTFHMNDSSIETGSPPLPAGYKDVFAGGGKVMMEVPFMLGMTGTCRSTNLLNNATAYYTNTHIKAKGWGALSIDNATNVKLYATKCLIETIDSGYGSYAMGGSINTFSGCTFNVADMALCGTGGDGIFTDKTIVNSKRFGIMYHGSGNITIDKGSVFNTKSTAIQLKSPGHNIVVDNAELNPENGIILQIMANDDPFMAGGNFPEGFLPSGPSSDSAKGEGASAGSASSTATMLPGASAIPDINAVFRNVTLKGDMIHADTSSCPVKISLEKTSLTGAVTTAVVKHATGPNGEVLSMKTPQLYKLIGEVTNTFCATSDKYGLELSLDKDSSWIVDKTSYLTGLTIAEGASIMAPKGSRVMMSVDGETKPIKTGTYKGEIIVAVTGK
jgi:hypothetical protein